MKLHGVVAVVLVMVLTMIGLAQGTELEGRVRDLFIEGDHGVRDLPGRLRQLGPDSEVISALVQLTSKHRLAKEGTPDFHVLNLAVASLGMLHAKSATGLLTSLLEDLSVHENIRAQAVRSLGEIDPQTNKPTLLKALDPSQRLLIRVYAAEGLAKTKDAEALKALERYSREEKDSYLRQQFEKAGQAMRANGVRPN